MNTDPQNDLLVRARAFRKTVGEDPQHIRRHLPHELVELTNEPYDAGSSGGTVD